MSRRLRIGHAALDYPLYGCDFVGNNGEFVLVGGGGGEGRSGVKNKLTLLDGSTSADMPVKGELLLSSDEDSPFCLATTEYEVSKGAFRAFVGINSSTKAQKENNNEHARSFLVQPRATKPEQVISFEEKGALFSPSDAAVKETYQRLVRLSPCGTDSKEVTNTTIPRLGAASTGLAATGEIVLFDPRKPNDTSNSLGRIDLGAKAEAADFDLRAIGDEGSFQLVYCTNSDLYMVNIAPSSKAGGKLQPSAPKKLYSRAAPTSAESPSFRSVAFLTASLILLLVNQPGQSGAELYVLKVDEEGASVRLRRKLHRSIKVGVKMDVATLGDTQGDEKQFVVAVSGKNLSIEVVSLDWNAEGGLKRFKDVQLLKEVHSLSITDLRFAPFRASDPRKKQFLKLVSVSTGGSVVLHSIPLRPVVYPPKVSHYVVNSTGQHGSLSTNLILAALIGLLSLITLQLGLEAVGINPVSVSVVSPRYRYMTEQFLVNNLITNPRMLTAQEYFPWQPIQEHELRFSTPAEQKEELATSASDEHVVLRELNGEIIRDVHSDPDSASQHGTKWEDLSIKQRELWKAKLRDSGDYVLGQGETIFKGIFFSELAGVVGRAVAG